MTVRGERVAVGAGINVQIMLTLRTVWGLGGLAFKLGFSFPESPIWLNQYTLIHIMDPDVI